MMLLIKTIIAFISNVFGISKTIFSKLNNQHKNNYVRVLNYHYVPEKNLNDLDKQIKYYKKYFKIIDYCEFKEFINGNMKYTDKPALLITFDDGMYDNYIASKEVLDKNEVKALFFVCGDRIVNNDSNYMKANHIKEMLGKGHSIGNHTKHHHRFSVNDSNATILDEVVESEKIINQTIGYKCDSFCWVGGEDECYTKNAFDVINKHYKYVFCTNTQVTTSKTNFQYIQRTNVEAFWNMQLIKFQISGAWDSYYKKKYERIANRLGIKL